jgi:putative PIN family toxin of toxin-antitoxin system
MNRAVFDTNVIVSGFLSPGGPPGRLVEWLRSGTVQAVLDDRVAAEYAEVLARPRFGLPSAEIDIVLAAIRSSAVRVEVGVGDEAKGLPDPDDAPFLECARAAGVPLVTGNVRHFPKSVARQVAVLTPAQYVTRLARAKPEG